MVRRKFKVFSEEKTIRVDEWLYNTCQELMDIFTNMNGTNNYQTPFLTLSETVLTMCSYSIGFKDGLLSKDDKYLNFLLLETSKKAASSTITLSYNDSFSSLVESLISRYRSLNVKLSFSETVRIALYHFTQIYNSEPEKPLLTAFVLISSSDSVVSGADTNERLNNITSFKLPPIEAPLKKALYNYYLNLPDVFLDGFDKEISGQKELLLEKLKVWIPAVTNFREAASERTIYAAEKATIDLTFMGYISYACVAKKITEQTTRDLLQSAQYPHELSSAYSVFPESYLPFSLFSILPFFHTKFKDEIGEIIAKKIRPLMKNIVSILFS